MKGEEEKGKRVEGLEISKTKVKGLGKQTGAILKEFPDGPRSFLRE
jgi:hypothetical protein